MLLFTPAKQASVNIHIPHRQENATLRSHIEDYEIVQGHRATSF